MHQNNRFLSELCSILAHKTTLILGVGSPLRSDDAAGLVLCDLLVARGVNCAKCEYGLENCIDVIAFNKPERLLVVDAALFENGLPGDVIIASSEVLDDKISIVTTHSIPLRLVLKILQESYGVKDVYLLGVYPKSLEIGSDMSSEVYTTLLKLVNIITTCLKQVRERRDK